MLITVNPADPRPIYQQIMDEIRRAIVIGTLAAEDSLPSVRQAATELRINPNTVQQAYRELEREGVVYVRRGRGTFVAGLPEVEAERRQLARSLARRTLQEAWRCGLTLAELIAELKAAAVEPGPEEEEE